MEYFTWLRPHRYIPFAYSPNPVAAAAKLLQFSKLQPQTTKNVRCILTGTYTVLIVLVFFSICSKDEWFFLCCWYYKYFKWQLTLRRFALKIRGCTAFIQVLYIEKKLFLNNKHYYQSNVHNDITIATSYGYLVPLHMDLYHMGPLC